jgi:glycosyltransferase involved in cell wall biosynthesis
MPVAQNTLGFLRDTLFMAPAILRGIPLVLHLHSGEYDEFARSAPLPVRPLVRALLRRAAVAIVLGASLRSMLEGIVPEDRVAMVPNCVPDIDPEDTERVHRAGGLRVLFLGNLIAGKGYGELIEAVEILVGEGHDVQVVLAGGSADEAHRRRVVARTAIHDRIRFTGPVDRPAKLELLRSADVLALPSYYVNEAHPLVILEAMAAGLPVVATRHAAIPEMVDDEVTGLLVAPRDVESLAAALRRLVADPQLRERLGRAGRARYLERFTVADWVERMGSIFDSAAARGRA